MQDYIDSFDTKIIPSVVESKRNDLFVSSVESFSSADIKCAPDREKFKSILPLIMRSAVMAVTFGIFCYSVYAIAARIADDKKQDAIYGALRQKYTGDSAVSKPAKLLEPNSMYTVLQMLEADGEYNEYLDDKTVDKKDMEFYHQSFLTAKSQNEDTMGFFVFRGMERFRNEGVEYPLMIGDNQFYLTHNYLKSESKSGSIFAEQSLDRDFDANYNMLIYGHDMTNGSMFRCIKLWFDSAKMKTLVNDLQVEIYNEDGVYIYELMSAYRTSDFNFTPVSFANESEYLSFLNSIYKRSVLNKKVEYTAESKICTLVTCTNVFANPDERYVVHGILKQFIPYE